MDVYATEHEQIETLKKWWKENGKAVIAGVVLGLSVLLVFWTWRDHTRAQTEVASAEYQLLIGDVQKGDTKAGLQRGAHIRNEYANTPYAVFAALATAKLALDKGDVKAARADLQWALEHADQDSLRHIARLRLTRVMIDMGEAEAALGLLASAQPDAFAAAYEEVRGDAYLKSGQADKAQAAYQRALEHQRKDAAQDDPEQGELLQMKLKDAAARSTSQPKPKPGQTG